MRAGFRFLNCPMCSRRGVFLKLKAFGEDNYQCRYCAWYAFTGGNSPVDQCQRDNLAKANPGVELV